MEIDEVRSLCSLLMFNLGQPGGPIEGDVTIVSPEDKAAAERYLPLGTETVRFPGKAKEFPVALNGEVVKVRIDTVVASSGRCHFN